MVSKLRLPVVKDNHFQVTVANGTKLNCDGVCLGLSLSIQGVQVKAIFLILPLVGCEAVLSVQWLRSLGPIKWDFQQMTMVFTDKTHNHKILERTLTELEVIAGDKIMKMGERGLLL